MTGVQSLVLVLYVQAQWDDVQRGRTEYRELESSMLEERNQNIMLMKLVKDLAVSEPVVEMFLSERRMSALKKSYERSNKINIGAKRYICGCYCPYKSYAYLCLCSSSS